MIANTVENVIAENTTPVIAKIIKKKVVKTEKVAVNKDTQTGKGKAKKEADPNAEPKEKKPTLSAKYSKFLVFGHWFINLLKNDDMDSALIETLRNKLTLFGDIAEQSSFVQGFLDDIRISTKDMKATIRNHNKINKKILKAKSVVDPNVEKPKRGRKKKEVTVVNDFRQNIVDEMVALANGNQPSTPRMEESTDSNELATEPVKAEKPKRKYVRKAKSTDSAEEVKAPEPEPEPVVEEKPKRKYVRKTKSTDSVETTESIESVKSEEKPKRKYNRKPKQAEPEEELVEALEKLEVKEPEPEPQPEPVMEVAEEEEEEEEEDEEEIICKPIVIDGVKYAIDQHFNVYDYKTHDEIGTYIDGKFELL